MLDEADFKDLLARVRNGEEEAAAMLLQRCEPEIRRIARVRLADAHLARLFESMDICQSVMANFFVRVAAGQFDLETPQQLMKLLVTMTFNKLYDHQRRHLSKRRGVGGAGAAPQEFLESLADPSGTPSSKIEAKELYEKACELLTPEERELVQKRHDGKAWADIAHECGENADALRKRHTRALDRVGKSLGLDEAPDE